MKKRVFHFGIVFFWSVLTLANFSPIQDEVGLVSKTWIQERVSLLKSVYQASQVQIQIVVAKNTNGQSIEAYSIGLVDKMRLGQKETDKGLLMLLVPSQREVRIEVGQGLEGDIPDIVAKRIIQDTMIPLFRNQQFEAGLDAGLNQILSIIAPMLDATQLKRTRGGASELPLWAQVLIFIFMIIFWIVGPRLGFVGPVGRGGRSMGGFGGFGGGGGGWSGGGGGFSGGGASGRW